MAEFQDEEISLGRYQFSTFWIWIWTYYYLGGGVVDNLGNIPNINHDQIRNKEQ